MADIASKLVPLFDGPVTDADRIADANGKVVMLATERQTLSAVADSGSPLFTRVGYLDTAGVLKTDANWATTVLLDLSMINVVSLKLLGQPAVSSIAFYDLNGVFVSGISATSNTEYLSVYAAPPASAAYVAFTRVAASINPAITPLIAGQVTDIRTAYRNVASASAQVRKEFELFTRVGFINSTGFLTTDAVWAATELIDVNLIDIVSLALVGHPAVSTIAYYTADRVFISKVSAASDGAVYTGYPALPGGTTYVAFTRRVASVLPGVQKFNANTAYRNLPGTTERAAVADRETKAFAIFTRAGYIDLTGALKADANWLATDLIDLAQYKAFSIRLRGHTVALSVAFYDAAKTFISGVAAPAVGTYVTAMPAIPAGAAYVAFTSNKVADERYSSVLSSSALPTPAVIAGRFPVELSQLATISGSYFTITNTITNDSNWRRSGFVKGSTDPLSVTLYGHPNVAAVQYFDANKALLGYYAPPGTTGAMFTTVLTPPANTAFYRFSFGDPAKLTSATSASIATIASVAGLYLQAQTTATTTTTTPLLAPFRAPRRIPFTAGMKNLLYGDSRSSADYPWFKAFMEALTGAAFYNGGFSGHTVAQNASEADLQRVWDYAAQGVISILPGGNDSGAAGTIGTFNGTVADEPVMTPADYSAVYAGTTFIQAVDYQIGRMKRQYENIRARAGLTGSETEVEKNNLIRALAKPMLVLLTDLPQQRTNAANVSSDPASWRRKRDAIVEVGHRHKVHTIDTMYELSIDLSLEPYFVGPTDKVTNNGVFTMDGLHLNEFGCERLARRVAKDIL